MMKRLVLLAAVLAATLSSSAQNSFVHDRSDGYVWPTDPLVLEKLDAWQDLIRENGKVRKVIL